MSLCLDMVTVRRGGREIVSQLALVARAGEVLAIVGPNGAGKSTALALASGAMVPDTGRVMLDGRPITDFPSRDLARRRAVVPQSARIAFPFRVHEVVAFGRAPHRGRCSAAEDARAVDESLARFDLDALADRNVLTLSGGEWQRVNLARAFAQVGTPLPKGGAQWLLLDEPTAALDPAHQIAILSAASDFARSGGGVLVILHDLRLAAAFADQVAVLRGGRLAVIGGPAEALAPQRVRDIFTLNENDARLFIAAEVRPDVSPSPRRAGASVIKPLSRVDFLLNGQDDVMRTGER